MNVLVIGIGYVGSAFASLFSFAHEVYVYDKDPAKTASLPFPAQVLDSLDALPEDLSLALLCLPTDFDPAQGHFDLSSIEETIASLCDFKGLLVLKSTIPVGYASSLKRRYPNLHLLYSPEFLRESRAKEDVLRPSRIVLGGEASDAEEYLRLLLPCLEAKDVPTLCTGYEEAESIKLFSNAYLALRVSFFNELDTYAASKGFKSKDIIDGVSLDPRIGKHYNNPSFGYGGYCLPKDTKQLASAYEGIPETLISATLESNAIRKRFIVSQIKEKAKGKTIGIYRLIMKSGSDSFRQSATLDVLRALQEEGCPLLLYEPLLEQDHFEGIPVCQDLDSFKKACSLIVANRVDPELSDVADKIYSRDIYARDE